MKNLKRFIFTFALLILSHEAFSQEYAFLPKGLHLVPISELQKPTKPLEFVFKENGERIKFDEALKKVADEEVIPKMYADSLGIYKALVISSKIEINYPDLPESLQKLGYSFGNKESDTIIIFSQGGPSLRLHNRKWQKSVLALNKEFGNYFFINARQTQMIEADKYTTKTISFEEAKKYNELSTQNVYRLVNFFKSKNKKVFLYGASGGAFLITDLIATYGNIADGYLIMVGRLDMNDEMWQARVNGERKHFRKDGKTIYKAEPPTSILGKNNDKLKAAGAYKRYTKLLEGVDLSNVIYFYGSTDDRVGSLLPHEVAFLKSSGATVIRSKGDHSSYQEYLEILLRLLLLD